MLRRSIISSVLLVLTIAAPGAYALGLDAARSQGLVGETPQGYVGAVRGGNSEVERLVASVNAKRRSRYSQIAKKNGLSVSAVAQQAGRKLTAKVPKGQYVKSNGRWQKR